MKKRMLSLCMVLVLCLGLLPATALAAAPSGMVIYVGTQTISAAGYWTTDSDGNVAAYSGAGTPTDNYIYYDANTNTLTLHNATIKTSNNDSYLGGAAIGVVNHGGIAELTIQLEGQNTLSETSKGIYAYSSAGAASLTITGSGSGGLTASGTQNGIRVESNSGDAALTIRNAKVEATVTSSSDNAVYVKAGQGSAASLTVDGGSLNATGSGTPDAGIRFLLGSKMRI